MRTPQEPRSSYFMGTEEKPLMGAKETWLEPESLTYPSGGRHRRCRAICEDGKLRIIRCGIPDTFFSVSAGKGGFITTWEDEESGLPIFRYVAYKRESPKEN